jgi:hypothetical protein
MRRNNQMKDEKQADTDYQSSGLMSIKYLIRTGYKEI